MKKPAGIELSALPEEDQKGVEQFNDFVTFGSAYAIAHATRPSTTGIVLNSSPIALLAW
jgi:microsomal epoxide hydrolase